jgi:hypothetical protein
MIPDNELLEHILSDVNELLLFDNCTIMTIADDGTLYAGLKPDYGHDVVLIPK